MRRVQLREHKERKEHKGFKVILAPRVVQQGHKAHKVLRELKVRLVLIALFKDIPEEQELRVPRVLKEQQVLHRELKELKEHRVFRVQQVQIALSKEIQEERVLRVLKGLKE